METTDALAMTSPPDDRERTGRILAGLSPGGRPFTLRIPLAKDECHWFNVAFDEGLIRLRGLPPGLLSAAEVEGLWPRPLRHPRRSTTAHVLRTPCADTDAYSKPKLRCS